ncbi:MAG: cob(I)yrinic acid a,c-diamide adenosyltransferase [Spirochaetes bacterium]|jgi:cob(I)alamin adenosyltransferase|nr:cob(I)yrinic acid a,c-diamide adenosyltransferase [Spirochaetota bacterium]
MAGFDRITTRAGDGGTSSLPGLSELAKDDALFAVLGDLDELSSALGLARSTAAAGALPGGARSQDVRRRIEWMQSLVIRVSQTVAGCRVAGGPELPDATVSEIEQAQGELMQQVRLPHDFVVPGGTRLSAEVHLARTICRRAERSCVSARQEYADAGLEAVLPVLNRLSDYAFVLALAAEPDPGAGSTETA